MRPSTKGKLEEKREEKEEEEVDFGGKGAVLQLPMSGEKSKKEKKILNNKGIDKNSESNKRKKMKKKMPSVPKKQKEFVTLRNV